MIAIDSGVKLSLESSFSCDILNMTSGRNTKKIFVVIKTCMQSNNNPRIINRGTLGRGGDKELGFI
jgi:hypothetical protein